MNHSAKLVRAGSANLGRSWPCQHPTLRLTSIWRVRWKASQGTPGWPLAAGTTLGKYQIVRLLGEGGMGAVYEGLHVEIGKRVAIKTISPALAAVPEARARFLLEAQLTSRVRHPHTVDVTDICIEGEQAFLVMEYLEGEDLAKHLRRPWAAASGGGGRHRAARSWRRSRPRTTRASSIAT